MKNLLIISLVIIVIFLGMNYLETPTGNVISQEVTEYHSPPSVVIEQGSNVETVDYIIFKDATNIYYAKNGSSGEIHFASTNATYTIQSAIDAVEAANEGGTVVLLEGEYNIENITIEKVTVRGQGSGTRINVTGSITLQQKSGWLIASDRGKGPRLWDVAVHVASGYNGSAVVVDGTNLGFTGITKVVDNLYIESPDRTTGGTGLRIKADSTTANAYVMYCNFGKIQISGFDYGIVLRATETSNNGYINGNSFDDIFLLDSGTTELYLEGVGNATVHGNFFQHVQLSPKWGGGTTDGIKLVDNSPRNYFNNVFSWDWAQASGYALSIASGIQGTYAKGLLANFDDNGTDTIIVGVLDAPITSYYYQNTPSGSGGVPMVWRGDFDTSSLKISNAPHPMRVIDVWVHCTEANIGGTVQLRDNYSGNNITPSITCDTLDEIQRPATINETYNDLTTSEALVVYPANNAKGTIYVMTIGV